MSESDPVQLCLEIFPKEPIYDRFVNEARFGLSRVLRTLSSFDPETVEVLEVGAGTCILSSYLASKRVHVTVVEPLGRNSISSPICKIESSNFIDPIRSNRSSFA